MASKTTYMQTDQKSNMVALRRIKRCTSLLVEHTNHVARLHRFPQCLVGANNALVIK
jgi:hypothetical protein